ncbi:related to acetyltransferase (nodulation protein nodL) [Cephalotrichum gorgonifer]|uniref:Related to acetyltransferase (Nodulation protein nodL) n=1 Tax=Cephalotrichum gorgonifer TaxID=2041049 RepID=A0AAE8ST20_9PEZI|nr:related to acetyltransferase (nodulation protein nodL) [Cephalotrichum gorgonifer]
MSTFTALNGVEKPVEATIKVADQRPASAGRANGQTSMTPSSISEPAKPAEPQREAWSASTSDRQPHYQQPPSYADTENSHKRKRSNTDETRRDQPPPAQPDRSPREITVQSAHSEPRASYEDRERDYRRYTDEQRQRAEWYASQNREKQSSYEHQQSQQQSQQSRPHQTPPSRAHSDDPSSEPSRKDQGRNRVDRSQSNSRVEGDYPDSNSEGDEHSATVYATSPYTTERKDTGVVQVDPKKRKRNFSNRTKTGCMTCRKRKKKCDEQKPECTNCLRGSFLCAGYPPQRGPVWQKPDNKAAAIPLESKDPTYVPPGAYGMPQHQQQGQSQQQQPSPHQSQPSNPYATPTSATASQQLPHSLPHPPQKRDSLAAYRGQPLRIDPPQGRPLVTEDDRHTASTIPSASVASPDNKLSALSYTAGASVFPTPVSANSGPAAPFSERAAKEYQQRVPPLHDLTRTDPDSSHLGTTLPQINIMNPTRTNSPITQHQVATSSAQVAAQLALAHTPFPPNRPRTQKEEMLAGRQFYPFDKELVLERERCNTACWRFNNCMNPSMGVSPLERARLFREILQPREAIQISPSIASPVSNIGRLGEDVVVEAPFTCDYGYNVSIGQNVFIGRNCTIQDSCEVKIGDNCVIGPNVSIHATTVSLDPKRRMGSKGPQIGRPITIEADCFIGAGALILPGRTIGKGSTVGAGAIVTKDVPPFTIVVGAPARVVRGVSS